MASKKVSKKKAGSKKRRAGAKRPIPGWIIMTSGILVGLLLAVFAYMRGWVPEPVNNPGQPVPGVVDIQPESEGVEDVSEDLSRKSKQEYDFYTVLPEMEIVIPKEEIEQTIARDSKNFTYMLQIGSFKSMQDAEKLKAKIAFIGQIAHIQSINVNDTQWHRVRVGPFDSSRTADGVKRKLAKSDISALLLKEAKEP